MNKKEIRIAGAGLAGLTAAINLAKAGYKVTVFEKNKDCGLRFAGDLQGFENWTMKKDVLEDLKSMNLDINFHYKPFNEFVGYDYKLNSFRIKSKKPFFYLIRRGAVSDSLDLVLKKQALDLGIDIKFGASVKPNQVDLVATGPSFADGIARGITFDTDMNDTARLILDDDIAPKGYAYLLINKGRGCLMSGMFRHFHKEEEYYSRFMERIPKALNLRIRNAKEFCSHANFFLERKYVHNGILYLGEAAGLQDYMAGFGMRYAITSGYLASESIIKNKDFEELMKKRFDAQLKTSLVNRFLFEMLGNRGYQFSIRLISKIINPFNFLSRNYNSSLFKRSLLPLAEAVMGSRKEDLHKECNCSWCRSRKQEVE